MVNLGVLGVTGATTALIAADAHQRHGVAKAALAGAGPTSLSPNPATVDAQGAARRALLRLSGEKSALGLVAPPELLREAGLRALAAQSAQASLTPGAGAIVPEQLERSVEAAAKALAEHSDTVLATVTRATRKWLPVLDGVLGANQVYALATDPEAMKDASTTERAAAWIEGVTGVASGVAGVTVVLAAAGMVTAPAWVPVVALAAAITSGVAGVIGLGLGFLRARDASPAGESATPKGGAGEPGNGGSLEVGP